MSAGILRNITWLSAGSAIVKPIWFVFVTVVCVRMLAPEEYGTMVAALYFMLIAGAFTDWGITSYSIREVARDRPEASTYFSNFLLVRLGLGMLAFFVALGIRALDYSGTTLLAAVFAGLYVLLLGLTSYCRSFYRAFETLRFEAVSIVVEKVLVIAAGVVLLYVYRTAWAVLAGMALGMFFILLLDFGWVHFRLTPFRLPLLDRGFVRRALPIAIPLGLASQFISIYYWSDTVMLDYLQGERIAGQYGLAYRILEAMVLLPSVVAAAILPRLSSLYHQKLGPDFQRIMIRSLGGLALLSLAPVFVLYFFSDPVIHLITDDATFAPSADALRILVWTYPFMCVNFILSIALTATDDQRMLAVLLGGAALFNVTLNLALIPRYSLFGASFATLATESLITVALMARYAGPIRTRLTEVVS